MNKIYMDNQLINANRLAMGNKKLAKTVAIFNLPAIDSCPNHESCYKTCYAMKAQRIYPNVRKFRNENFKLAQEFPEALVELIADQIKLKNIKVVRIHESGDFFNQRYIDMWAGIIKRFPGVKFYAYTKTLAMFDFSKILLNENFNIVDSFVKLKSGAKILNYGLEDYIKSLAVKTGYPVCPCKKGVKVVCGTDCTICQTEKNVLFIKH